MITNECTKALFCAGYVAIKCIFVHKKKKCILPSALDDSFYFLFHVDIVSSEVILVPLYFLVILSELIELPDNHCFELSI